MNDNRLTDHNLAIAFMNNLLSLKEIIKLRDSADVR